MAGRTSHNNLPAPRTDVSGNPFRRRTIRALAHTTAPLRAHPRLSIGATIAALAVTAGAILLLQPNHSGQTSVDPRTRVFANYNACLLTGPAGVDPQPASAIWQGMQQASTATDERVTNQPIIGAQTTQNAEEYINTLASLRCRVVITIGQDAARAVADRAAAYPDVQFFCVAAGLPKQGLRNVRSLASTSSSAIAANVTEALVSNFDGHNSTANPARS
jgi:hypothetical protein